MRDDSKNGCAADYYQADTFETFPSVRLIGGTHLIEGCKDCAMFFNDQHSTVTLYCDTVAYAEFKFITFHYRLNLFVNAKTLTDFSTYFKDVIQNRGVR